MPRKRVANNRSIDLEPMQFLSMLRNSRLHTAAAEGDFQTIQDAIRAGEDLNVHYPPYATPIFVAIRSGNLQMVKELVGGGADVNVKDANLETPLLCAVHHGKIEIVELLLDKGADINARRLEYDSALHDATKKHSLEIMELLIDRGLDVNTRNKRDETALHIVAELGEKDVVQLLLRKGADINAVSCSRLCNTKCTGCGAGDEGINIGSNITALFLAVLNGHLDIVDILLKAGADPNKRTSEGLTPLHIACYGFIPEKRMELVNMLLKAGADANAVTNEGVSPLLFLALRGNCTDVVAVLLTVKGIDINPKADSGTTPLVAAAVNGHLEIVKLLVAKGAPINESVRFQTDMYLGFFTPLGFALEARKDSVVEFLIRSGADVYKRDPTGLTPFFHACRSQGFSPKIGKLFIEKGIDVNEAFVNNQTLLLMIACVKGDLVECAQFLVEHGANPDVGCSKGLTPLHCGINQGNLKIVEYLITKVKEIDPVDIFSQTPLKLATHYGYHTVMEMLLNNGANPDMQDEASCAALHVAARKRQLESAKVLLKYKATVSIKDISSKVTPLHIAVENKDEKMVNLLLNSDADPNAANISGVLPIHLSYYGGNIHIVKALLEKGAYYNVSAVTEKYLGPPLKHAQKAGHTKLVTLLELIEKLFDAMVKNNAQEMKCCIEVSRKLDFTGAVVNARNASGMTALYYAVNNGNIEAVNTLLANDADIGLAANRGDTPLHVAISNENVEIAEIFLTHAKKLTFLKSNNVINAKTSGNGTTVLHLAAENNSFHLVKWLIKNGAVYNIKNKSKQMPSQLTTSEYIKSFFNSVKNLFDAVGNNNLEEVVRILEIDSSVVNARDMDGGATPLYLAVSKSYTEMAKHLLTIGADCCLVTNKGTTTLHIAASKGNVEMVKALVARVNESEDKANSFVDAQTLRGTTALHAASGVDVVKYLLQSGATYNIRNCVGMTPLKSTQNTDIRKLLKTTHGLFRDVKKGVPGVIDTLNDLEVEEFKAIAKTRNEEGKTLAVVAVASGHVKIASKLLEKLQKIG